MSALAELEAATLRLLDKSAARACKPDALVAELVRAETSDHGTFGRLTFEDFSSFTCEPPWRDNRRGLSCIPVGTYLCQPHLSPRYKRCYLVTGVPDRSLILFHGGNVGGDVKLGFHTHTRGCVLQGARLGFLHVKGRRQRAVLSSRPTVRSFFRRLDGRPFYLAISEGNSWN